MLKVLNVLDIVLKILYNVRSWWIKGVDNLVNIIVIGFVIFFFSFYNFLGKIYLIFYCCLFMIFAYS